MNEMNFEQEMESQFSLADYLRILYRGRWIIILSFVIVFLSTVYYTYTTAPVYQATTSVMIENKGRGENSIFEINYLGNQNTAIANQIEILKSRTLAEGVVKRLDLSDVRDSLTIFRPNEMGEFRSFRSMVAAIRGNMSVENIRDTDIININYKAGSSFESAYIANTIAYEFQRQNAEANKSEVSELRAFVEEQLNKKRKELRESEERLRAYQALERVTSLDEETNELITRLAEVEAQLEEARIELQANLELKRSMEEQLENRKQTLATNLSEISTPYITSLQNQLAQTVAKRTMYITAIESEQQVNKRHFEDGIKEFDDKINALKEKLREEARKITASSMVKDPFQLSQDLVTKLLTADAEIKALTAKISALQGVVSEYNKELENVPDMVLDLARLERRRKVDEQTFIMLTQKLEETKIQEAAKSKNVRIIDEAIAPATPVSPNKRLNMMLGALIGLGLGIGLTFLIEYFDNGIKTHEQLERMGYNLLSSIPKIEMDKVEKKLESRMKRTGAAEGKKIEARLITHLDPKSPVSEAYRTLRTNLQFSKVDRDLRSILVTSAGPKEGKSTTAANLAIALAQFGKRTVLIDADLRRPVIHSIFGIQKEPGITNFLMDNSSYETILRPTFMDNLNIITSGVLPPNPSELLATQKMKDLIGRLEQDFDHIIFDSPPVIAVTDAAILSDKVDGTILVIYAGQTNREALNRAKTLLDNVDAKMLGVLLNGVDVEGMYGSYYYYYYHHYYSKPGGRKKKRIPKFLSG